MKFDFVNFLFGLVISVINSLGLVMWIRLFLEKKVTDSLAWTAILISMLSIIVSINIIIKSFRKKH